MLLGGVSRIFCTDWWQSQDKTRNREALSVCKGMFMLAVLTIVYRFQEYVQGHAIKIKGFSILALKK